MWFTFHQFILIVVPTTIDYGLKFSTMHFHYLSLTTRSSLTHEENILMIAYLPKFSPKNLSHMVIIT